MSIPLFGVSGNPVAYSGSSSLGMPEWLAAAGIDAYEYQAGRGVKISKDAAQTLGENAREYGITLSIHSPYFINIASEDDKIIDSSLRHIMESMTAAHHMGAGRVVVHMGGAGAIARRRGIDNSKRLVVRALDMAKECGLYHIRLCPETMGKINQLGTVQETLEVCKVDENLIPTLDFGHINARQCGLALAEKRDPCPLNYDQYKQIIVDVKNALGEYRGNNFHCHFSKIEYTKGGEKKHLAFTDAGEYGPDFPPFARVLVELGATPHIICESRGTQNVDTLTMKSQYLEAAKTNENNGDKRP